MNTSRHLMLLGLVFFLAACQNPYSEFYSDYGTIGTLPPVGEPTVRTGSGNPDQDIAKMFEDGFGLIGEANFTGPQQDSQKAIIQAKKVRASIVLINREYQNTKSGTIPITTPTTSTAYTSGTVNTYGGYGGYGYGSYSGTTTIYGSTASYIPYSVDHYSENALFFAPLERRGLGILPLATTLEQKQKAGTNKGISVGAVRRGSPAFEADIIPGDILLSIGDHPTNDTTSAAYAISVSMGEPAEIVIIRSGQKIQKIVTVPHFGW